MSISKIAMLTFGMAILTSSTFLGQQAFGGINGCLDCTDVYDTCTDAPLVCQAAYDECHELMCKVGGLLLPINESEVFGELAQQYSLWLIPAISAIGIGAFLVKRKF